MSGGSDCIRFTAINGPAVRHLKCRTTYRRICNPQQKTTSNYTLTQKNL